VRNKADARFATMSPSGDESRSWRMGLVGHAAGHGSRAEFWSDTGILAG
jgi:hypothetical protein